MSMVNVAGVQFRRAGHIFDYNLQDHIVKIGEHVVVETERGHALAKVVQLKYVDDTQYIDKELKPILRKATEKDLQPSTLLTEEHALSFTKEKVKELKLEMRVQTVDIQFGGNKVIVYFTAPSRVDFRELVKKLASGLKSRVELKQIGARDETKILGGLGICGREYCCSSFLRDFIPVSIKMAKNQNLALNPHKVSGGCGRLLCCLTYEDSLYTELRQKLPPRGALVELQDGKQAKVKSSDLFNQEVTVIVLDDQSERIVPVNQLLVLEKPQEQQDSIEQSDDETWAQDIDLEALQNDDDTMK